MRALRILLLEDDPSDARSMKRYISQSGAELVQHCRNMDEFNKYWPESTADLAILDLQIGRADKKRSGWEAATTIATSNRSIPMIVWSNFNDQDTWRRIPNHENLVGPLDKDGTFGQFQGTLYTTIIKCYPDAEEEFILPEGHTGPGQGMTPKNGKFSVKVYGTKDKYILDARFIRYVETSHSARVKIHHRGDIVECTNSLEGVLDYIDNPDLVQISRYAIININYAYKVRSTDCVYVQTINGRESLPIGKEYKKNMHTWWGRLKSPTKVKK